MDAAALITRLETAQSSFHNLELQLADPDIASDPKQLETISRERSRLEPLVIDYQRLQLLDKEFDEATKLLKDSKDDKEMGDLAQEEIQRLDVLREELVKKLTIALLPKDPRDERSVMLEIRAGAGGNEACLWAGDLARMYERYGQKIGWSVKPISSTEADVGGFRELILSVKGQAVFSQLKFEAGVHRVQRVPATESQGRVHTSTATIAVMPEADPVEVQIDPVDIDISTARFITLHFYGKKQKKKIEMPVKILLMFLKIMLFDEKAQKVFLGVSKFSSKKPGNVSKEASLLNNFSS